MDGRHRAETRVLGEWKLGLAQRKIDELAAIRAALERLVERSRAVDGGKAVP